MTSATVLFDIVLCALIAGLALCCVVVRDLFAATVLLITFGVFVAIAWVRLEAVDVALAEAAIGAGLTGVLLIGAASRLQERQASNANVTASAGVAASVISTVAGALMAAGLGYLVLTTAWVESLQPLALANLPWTGLGNPVTAVLLNYRGYDTLLETVVLFAALVGSWAAIPDESWGARAGALQHARSAGVLATFGRLLPPLGVLLGVHLFWAGADNPGGAFQAGTVLAAVWILAIMAGAMDAPVLQSSFVRSLVVAGPLLFAFIAVAGVFHGSFLILPAVIAKPLTLAIEAGLTISIAATLMLLVLGGPRRAA